jgi:hypothetical protein
LGYTPGSPGYPGVGSGYQHGQPMLPPIINPNDPDPNKRKRRYY